VCVLSELIACGLLLLNIVNNLLIVRSKVEREKFNFKADSE